MLARFLSSISSFCFIYALTPLFEFLRYFGFPNTLLRSLFAWLNLWDFVRTFLDRASDCESRVFLVLIVVLSYAVLILFVRGALGVIGTFLFGFSNRIWGSHSPPLWSPIWSFSNWRDYWQLARETEGRSGGVYEQNLHAPLDEDREDGVHYLHDCTKGLFAC